MVGDFIGTGVCAARFATGIGRGHWLFATGASFGVERGTSPCTSQASLGTCASVAMSNHVVRRSVFSPVSLFSIVSKHFGVASRPDAEQISQRNNPGGVPI